MELKDLPWMCQTTTFSRLGISNCGQRRVVLRSPMVAAKWREPLNGPVVAVVDQTASCVQHFSFYFFFLYVDLLICLNNGLNHATTTQSQCNNIPWTVRQLHRIHTSPLLTPAPFLIKSFLFNFTLDYFHQITTCLFALLTCGWQPYLSQSLTFELHHLVIRASLDHCLEARRRQQHHLQPCH